MSARVGALYEQEEYAAALAVIRAERGSLPTYGSDLAHLAACLHALAGNPAAALRDLQGAAADGAWWHPRLLLDDEDLAAVRGLPGFDDLVAGATARSTAAQAAAHARPPVVHRPVSAGERRAACWSCCTAPVRTPPPTAARWSAAVEHGFLLVAVDSSQLSTPTYRTWPDTDAATVGHRGRTGDHEQADRELPVVAGGFSAGARAALLWALGAQPMPVAGVVAVAPAVWPEQTSGAVHQPAGVVVIGADDDLLPTTREALEHLPGVRLEVVEALAHDYPDDFAGWLPPALDEVLPQP